MKLTREPLVPCLAMLAYVALSASGCFTGADGRQPDPERFYFPTGVEVSAGNTTLYVANSDFDLGFAGGWVQALDLRLLREQVLVIASRLATSAPAQEACAAVGLGLNPDPWLTPGRCEPFELAPFLRNHAFVGAFSSGLLLTHNPSGPGARLFAPVRGDPSITYFDVDDDRDGDPRNFQLECQIGADGFCDAAHRLGQDREGTLRGVQLPADPVGIAATADGVAIVTAHQTQASASLLINEWDRIPELAYFVPNLATGPTEVATIPEPGFVPLARSLSNAFVYRNGFMLTFRAAAELNVLRYFSDAGSVPPRPFITRAQALPITTNSGGFDSRGVAVVDTARRRCESSCQALAEPLDCLLACAEQIPMRLYVANRAPPSLLIGRIETIVAYAGEEEAQPTSAFEEVYLFDVEPLRFGPSRMVTGQVVNGTGELVDRVFVVAFDSRSIFIFDPALERIELSIRTGRGPHDIAIDSGIGADGEPYSMLYVGHFTDSYLGVVDLDQRRALTYGQMVASIGDPSPPLESQ